MMDATEAIRRHYATAARANGDECCPPRQAYSPAEVAVMPPGSFLTLGTGNPLRDARLQKGEVVVDLGSGAGLDVLLAAKAVGPTGRAIGIDFTPEMLARARASAEAAGVPNAEFLASPIEEIPLPDASADVVISNCVINLSLDKGAVLREAHRVLRPGGRFVVSDTLRDPTQPATDAPACDCTTGALSATEWRAHLGAAGFVDVELREGPAMGSVGTATVRARKA